MNFRASPPRARGRRSRSLERADARSGVGNFFRREETNNRNGGSRLRKQNSEFNMDHINNVFFGDFVPDRIYPVQPNARPGIRPRVQSSQRQRRVTATTTVSALVRPSRFGTDTTSENSVINLDESPQRNPVQVRPPTIRARALNRMHTVDGTLGMTQTVEATRNTGNLSNFYSQIVSDL